MDKSSSVNKEQAQQAILEAIQSEPETGTTRRRLLKQAAVAGPVILTLRSGALMAASSCTGTKTSVTDPTTDVCADTYSSGSCPAGKVDTVGSVSQPTPCDTASNCQTGQTYYCKSGVILSSAAYTSLTG